MEPELPCKQTGQVSQINAVSASMVERSSASSGSEDAPMCWICLDYSGKLVFPCKCPRMAHPKCLARWQLQSAGTRKERYCEFCDSQLPDWKHALTPRCGSNAPAVMNVNFDGHTYSFEVKPGPDGYRLFTEAIRRAFSLPDDSELNITFTCDEPTAVPDTGSLLTLQGPGAYDAAVHCASVSAARRLGMPPSPRRPGSSSSEGGLLQGGGPETPRSALARLPSAQTTPSASGLSPDGVLADGASADGDGAGWSARRTPVGNLLGKALSKFLPVKR